jgi:RNA polymerase-binding transcription factor DksA
VQLILTEQDAQTLRDLLHDYLPDLAREAARTHLGARELGAELSRRVALCERLLKDLGPGGPVPHAWPEAAGHHAVGCAGKSCRSAAGLSPTEVAAYRQRLWEAAARLGGQVTALEAEARQPTGTAVGTAEEATALSLLHTEEGSLAEVNAALDRIDRGTYGRCEACGKPVAKTRLDALPHARHCIACARTAPAAC